jgi:hypothetical protein
MARTPRDQYSMYGNFRIYNKNWIEDSYERGLHEGGPWFVEPKDYDRAAPVENGFRSFDDAKSTADYREEESRRGSSPH